MHVFPIWKDHLIMKCFLQILLQQPLGCLGSCTNADVAPSALAASKRAPMQGGPAKFPKDPWRWTKEFNVNRINRCHHVFAAQTAAPISISTWNLYLSTLPQHQSLFAPSDPWDLHISSLDLCKLKPRELPCLATEAVVQRCGFERQDVPRFLSPLPSPDVQISLAL